ncbi:MAG: sulfatase-like hydrolase/transferase, partial [Pirellulales bacterium]|nr:sulfatase-like hydrolase/transferase [Pirellulales bacterium]
LLSWSGSMLEHFAKAGYRTGWVGKNHTYEKEAVKNIDYVSIRDREPFRAYNGTVPPHWHTDVYWPEQDCYPQVNSDHAVKFLDESKANGEPFFLHVSYFDPHPPYMAPAEYSSRYVGDQMILPPYVPAGDLSPRLEEFKHAFGMDRVKREDLAETMRYYLAQIEWGVDKQVGRLLRHLERSGLADDTVVVFTSDHGDFMGSHHLVRKGMFLYDALLHVPLIWWSPRLLPRGLKTSAFAQHTDFFPTLAELAGKPASGDLPGRSLVPMLRGAEPDREHQTIFTSAGYDELGAEQLNLPLDPGDTNAVPRHTQVMRQNMNPRYRTAMVRTPEWKLVMTETRGPELYPMNGGVVERKNVADEKAHAGARAALEKKLDQWWQW